MNNELFQQARFAYENKEYGVALQAYTECLQDEREPLAPGETGLLYHQIGNCLVKMKDYHEAIHAYTQATADSAYDQAATVNTNLGTCYAALSDYENAVRHFEIAVSDAKSSTPYKAHMGLGNALLKLGKSAEAGVAFRQAALDERNPDPTKALLNLGVCFMALNRPLDAISSYESAIPFRMAPATKNKLFANLGQAHVAAGQMQNAVRSFETALADQTYLLSDSASVDYQRAVTAVSNRTTSEATAILAPVDADMSGLDVHADGLLSYPDDDYYGYDQVEYYDDDPYALGHGSAEAEDRFFSASDEELEQWSKGVARQQRRHRNVGLKILVAILVLILILFGVSAFAYTQGFGYPSQETVAQELFANPEAATDSLFAKDVSSKDAAKLAAEIPSDPNITIAGVNKTMSESKVYVVATTEQGGELQYEVSMVRDMIGWKVSDVQFYFSSQN